MSGGVAYGSAAQPLQQDSGNLLKAALYGSGGSQGVGAIAGPGGTTGHLLVSSARGAVQETTTVLAASATFTGANRDGQYLPYFGALAISDQDGTLYTDSFDFTATLNEAQVLTSAIGVSPAARGAKVSPMMNTQRYGRARYVNGATAQTVFQLYTTQLA